MHKQLVKCFKDACNALTDARLEALEQDKELSLDECEEIMANHLIAHGVTVQEWISVKDRLPETTRLCIASKYNIPFLAWWTGKDWREANTVTVVDGINYWMELPQPPKGE